MKIGFAAFASVLLLLTSCGGSGGNTTPSTSHTVNISWTANRETAVNSAGGGYIVAINGQAPVNVPYISGAAALTTTTLTLMSGSYSGTVTAYSALNPTGGTTGSMSAPSAFTFSVP